MPSSRAFSASAVLLAVLLLGACGSSGSGSGSSPSPRLAAQLFVSDAWVRPTVDASQPSAAYLAITNGSAAADVLMRVSSPVAASVELHQTSVDASGMAGMQPMAQLDIPAGATVTFQPGGLHLMLTGLTGPLRVGDHVELDLTFQDAGTIVVDAEVRQG
jgi:copper(I)-binding protein